VASKLATYQHALHYAGQRKIADLTEAVEPRYLLDDHWTACVRYCLERGMANFALRTIQIDASTSVEPAFGFAYAFLKQSDWIRTVTISDNETLSDFNAWRDEGNYIYADVDPIFWQYVSDGDSYGNDLSLWPETFEDYVAIRLAKLIAPVLTASQEKMDWLEKAEKRARVTARATDAMNQPIQRPPTGTWARSRGLGLSSGTLPRLR
jgi:hypothetical protein